MVFMIIIIITIYLYNGRIFTLVFVYTRNQDLPLILIEPQLFPFYNNNYNRYNSECKIFIFNFCY